MGIGTDEYIFRKNRQLSKDLAIDARAIYTLAIIYLLQLCWQCK